MSKLIDQSKGRNQTISDEQDVSSAPRQCLLVLGMHRSGTSAMTRVLSLAGAALPKRLMGASEISNITGHWEPDALAQYHDIMLAEMKTSWHDWRPLDMDVSSVEQREEITSKLVDIIRADYGDEGLLVLKDPRICRFASFFMDVLRSMDIEPLPVLIFRNPLEVMDSLERRDGMSRAKSALLWLRHVLEAERASRGERRVFTTYAGMLENWRLEFGRLVQNFDLKNLQDADEIASRVEEFLSPDLRHSTRKAEEIQLNPMLAGWIMETWKAFQILVEEPDSKKAQARLDDVRKSFNSAVPMLAGYIGEVMKDKDSAISLLDSLVESKDMALSAKAEVVGQLKRQLDKRESELTARFEEVGQLKGELDQKETALTAIFEEVERLKGQLDEKDAALREMDKQTAVQSENFNQQLRESVAMVAHVEGELHAIRSSRSWKVTVPLRLASYQYKRITLLRQLMPAMRSRFGGYLPLGQKLVSVMKTEGATGVKARLARFALNPDRKPLAELAAVTSELTNSMTEYDIEWRRILHRQKHKNKSSFLNKNLEVLASANNPTLADRISAGGPPVISLLTPVYNTPEDMLREMVSSVLNQSYPYWELVLVDDASPDPKAREIMREFAAQDSRIKTVFLKENGGISVASNAALSQASGEYVGLLDHDDLLAPEALYENVRVINAWPEVDFLYSDEDKIDESGKHFSPYFKPDWSPLHLLARMFTGHFSVYRRALVEQAGGFRSAYDGTQDYDLALRISELTEHIYHIPRLLYHWRASEHSTAASLSAKPYTIERQKLALQDAMDRRKVGGKIHPMIDLGNWRPFFDMPDPVPKVSIVIPTAGQSATVRGQSIDLLVNCMTSILEKSSYKTYEFVIVHNGDLTEETTKFLSTVNSAKLVHYDKSSFNLAEKINLGVEQATGTYVVLLNDDIELITDDWLESMVRVAQHEDVGAVGAKLFYENGTLQHAGVVMMSCGGPSHSMIGVNGVDPGPDLVNNLLRNVVSVTGACLMCRRDRFVEIGGFDLSLPLNYNDVDFCLRLRDKGWDIVMEPSAQLYHFESISKSGTYEHELTAFMARWGEVDDPYYNLNFDRTNPFFNAAPYAYTPEPSYESWLSQRVAQRLQRYDETPVSDTLYSFVTSAYNTPPRFLEELETAVLNQIGCKFEWILLDNGSTEAASIEALKRIAQGDSRVHYYRVEENLGIMGGMRYGFLQATGMYYLPLDSDDILTCDALLTIDHYVSKHNFPDLLYSDEDKSSERSDRFSPFMKPDWDPVMFFGCCYVAHLCAIRRDKALSLEAYADDKATGCHDWDTFYRFLRAESTPVHVPELIYSWRIHSESTASADASVKPYTVNSQEYVLSGHIEKIGKSDLFEIAENPLYGHSGMWYLKRKRADAPRVLLLAVGSVGHEKSQVSTKYPNFQVIEVPCEKEIADFIPENGDEFAYIAVMDRQITDCPQDWLWDGVGLLQFFDDAAVVGGQIRSTSGNVLWAGGCFGYQNGRVCPDAGRAIEDSGYHGKIFLQRSIDTFSPLFWVAPTAFLINAKAQIKGKTHAELAGKMALLARKDGKRVIASPFMSATVDNNDNCTVAPDLDIDKENDFVISSYWYPRRMSSAKPWHLS